MLVVNGIQLIVIAIFCMWANSIPILPLFIIIKLIKSPVENEELTLI